MWIYTGNKLTKFHGNILSLSENIAKFQGGGYFFDSHCRLLHCCIAANRPVSMQQDREVSTCGDEEVNAARIFFLDLLFPLFLWSLLFWFAQEYQRSRKTNTTRKQRRKLKISTHRVSTSVNNYFLTVVACLPCLRHKFFVEKNVHAQDRILSFLNRVTYCVEVCSNPRKEGQLSNYCSSMLYASRKVMCRRLPNRSLRYGAIRRCLHERTAIAYMYRIHVRRVRNTGTHV